MSTSRHVALVAFESTPNVSKQKSVKCCSHQEEQQISRSLTSTPCMLSTTEYRQHRSFGTSTCNAWCLQPNRCKSCLAALHEPATTSNAWNSIHTSAVPIDIPSNKLVGPTSATSTFYGQPKWGCQSLEPRQVLLGMQGFTILKNFVPIVNKSTCVAHEGTGVAIVCNASITMRCFSTSTTTSTQTRCLCTRHAYNLPLPHGIYSYQKRLVLEPLASACNKSRM